MKRSLLLLLLMFGITVQAQELDDIVEEISTAIELDEAQTKVLATELEKYTISMQMIFDKYEEAEPDPQAMLTDIKRAQADYNDKLKAGIGKDKFKAYDAYVDQVKMEIFSEAAGLRLLDLQDPLKMTDDQVQQMKPVMGKAMKGMMETLMKYVDQKMNVRTKLAAANALKGIKKTMDREAAAILSPEQIELWNKLREEAAAASQEAQ